MRSHHHLFAWQKANASALAVHRHIDAKWAPRRHAVFEQLRRASLSVPLNIAEGYASGPGGRCRYHLRIAYASAVEATELLNFLEQLGEGVPELIAGSREVQAVSLRLMKATPR